MARHSAVAAGAARVTALGHEAWAPIDSKRLWTTTPSAITTRSVDATLNREVWPAALKTTDPRDRSSCPSMVSSRSGIDQAPLAAGRSPTPNATPRRALSTTP